MEVLDKTPGSKTQEILFEDVVMKLAGFWQKSNPLSTLWFTMQKHTETQQIVEHFESIWIPALAQGLMDDIPQLKPARAELAAFVILQSLYPLLDQSALLPPPQARLLIQETTFTLKSYISALGNLPADQAESLNLQAKKSWPLK